MNQPDTRWGGITPSMAVARSTGGAARTPGGRWLCYVVMVLTAVWSSGSSLAGSLTWQSSRSNAMEIARAEGKLVLLMAGRPTCTNCNYMKYTVCESTNPPIHDLIKDRFVPWFCDLDQSDEWRDYATGLVSFTLPMICCVAPNRPTNRLDRTTGVHHPPAFHVRLSNQPCAVLTNALITGFSLSNRVVRISLGNLSAWATNRLERCFELTPSDEWTVVWTRISTTLHTNWSETLSNTWPGVFYRVSSRR